MPESQGRSRLQRCWYRFLQFGLRIAGVLFFRMRVLGADQMPETGPVVVLANHCSHLDPPLIGVALWRPLNFLARETLFHNRWFGALIRSLDAIPIDRDGPGLAGLRETLRRLKRGEPIVVFPEGSRSHDGRLAELKPGFVVLLRRTSAAALPIGISGAYEALPRGRSLPRLQKIVVAVEEPISADEIAAMDDAEVVAEVAARITRATQLAAARRAPRRSRSSDA